MNIAAMIRFARIVFKARKLIAAAVAIEAIVRKANKSSAKKSKKQPQITHQAQDFMSRVADQMTEYGTSLKKHYNSR